MQELVETLGTIQLAVNSSNPNHKPVRNLMVAISHALRRAERPGVLIIPEKDRYELKSSFEMLARTIDRDADLKIVRSDDDMVEHVLDETHHCATIHVEADSISIPMQKRIIDFWERRPYHRPTLMLFVVRKDPGELMQEGAWSRDFRVFMHMPTFRWPDSPSRLRSPKHRLAFFLDVFNEVSRKFGQEPVVDPGARTFLLKTFFTKHTPLYTGNYVKLAADLIATMRKHDETELTTKVVLTLMSPGSEFALG